jgi:glycerol-3-phosphate dehydrogenase (NAD(P)+)
MTRSTEIRVAVIGAGSWGTTVAALASANTPTVLWARRPELADQINSAHVNPDYLPAFTSPRLNDLVDRRAVMMPTSVMAVLRTVSCDHWRRRHACAVGTVVSRQKSAPSVMRMSGGGRRDAGPAVGVMTGPNLAEILAGQPAASVWRLFLTQPNCSGSPSQAW